MRSAKYPALDTYLASGPLCRWRHHTMCPAEHTQGDISIAFHKEQNLTAHPSDGCNGPVMPGLT